MKPRSPEDTDPTAEEEVLEFDGTQTVQLDDTYRVRVVSASETGNGVVDHDGRGHARMVNEFDEARALFDESVAMYEAAKAEFDALQRAIHEQVMAGKALLASQLNQEELTRVRLFHARDRLWRHKRR